jgi:hypothetical protein
MANEVTSWLKEGAKCWVEGFFSYISVQDVSRHILNL